MIDRKEIIKALRCSNNPGGECREDCRYRYLEPVNEDIPLKPDVIIEGQMYWESCNYEQIALDAADALEELGADWHDMREDPEDAPGKDVERYLTVCEKRHVVAWKELKHGSDL